MRKRPTPKHKSIQHQYITKPSQFLSATHLINFAYSEHQQTITLQQFIYALHPFIYINCIQPFLFFLNLFCLIYLKNKCYSPLLTNLYKLLCLNLYTLCIALLRPMATATADYNNNNKML